MQLGLFLLRVEHPQIDIPSKYNVDTTLGVDYGEEDILSRANARVFQLKSK